MEKQPTFEELVAKVERLKASGEIDLSMEEDLSIAVMNLISLEEHFYFTAEKTGKEAYFDLLGQVREMRKQLLGKLIGAHEGETWCVAKHLLAATMRLMEVGTKLQSSGKKEESREMFAKAYEAYSLFWALRLKLVTVPALRPAAAEPATTEDLIKRLVDCCKE